MGPLYCPCKEVTITSLWLSFDLPSMTPGESHNEWYHYYCSFFYVFKINIQVYSITKSRSSDDSRQYLQNLYRFMKPNKAWNFIWIFSFHIISILTHDKPSFLFVGHRQTEPAQIRRRKTQGHHCLISECSIIIWIKMKKYHSRILKSRIDWSIWYQWEIPFGLNGLLWLIECDFCRLL